jgi:ATP:corrinoid adenosyltransferase
VKEDIVFEEFSGSNINELLVMLSKEDDIHIKDEFSYPIKYDKLDHESLRNIFNSYRTKNDKYASLKICI